MAGPNDLTPDEFEIFQEFIYRVSGIRMSVSKRTLLSNRVRRRLVALDLPDFQSYFRYLQDNLNSSEYSSFLDAVTTNETSFLRTEKHFDWFGNEFIGELVESARRDKRPKSIRCWSAACSTGEEAYSIAICLHQNKFRLRGWKLHVDATDLSQEAIESAKLGTYKERAFREAPERFQQKYFEKLPDEPLWKIKRPIQQHVQFRTHNLLNRVKEEPYDCVFIRNVLIYFDKKSKQTVVDNLVNSLNEGGYLVVGPSEGIYDMLSELKRHSTFLYQK